MNTPDPPHVIVIDDEPTVQVTTLKLALPEVQLTVIGPDEVELSDLTSPSLVLVDYHLDAWNRPREPIAMCPPNGVALAGILRQHSNGADTGPIAFAVYSAYLSELSSPLPPERREALIARSHNLEWAFLKAQPGVDAQVLYRQIRSLAEAVSALPRNWPTTSGGAVEKLAEFLGISGQNAWTENASHETLKCQPPLNELSTWTHGVALIRWLLHRVLPYPCFLLDCHYLAKRLGSTPRSVAAALSGNQKLTDAIRPYEYKGALAGFLGQRWWRSGIEAFLEPFGEGAVVPEVMAREFGIDLERLTIDEPVVCLDSRYRPLEDLIDVSQAVRLQVDDWPPYASGPYAEIESAREDEGLRNLVHPLDKGMLG